MSARKIAILGFGSQGRAHAVRLRNSGVRVVVGLKHKSRTRRAAKALGFPVAIPAEAVVDCDVVAILVPDREARKVLQEIGAQLKPGSAVVFAAGYPLVFPKALRAKFDLLLVAPHGPGRELEEGLPMSGFIGVGHDHTGRALTRARSYAKAIGLKPLYESTPRQETLGDLFGEQALLCGGLLGLTSAVAAMMVKKGIPKSHVWYETVSQLESLSRLLAKGGVEGFWGEISDCAAAGAAWASPNMFGKEFDRALRVIWQNIESGKFAREFQAKGRPRSYPASWKVIAQVDLARRTSKEKGRPQGPPFKNK